MINPHFSINKAFKEKLTKFMKYKFGAMTQQHISRILSKKNARVLALFMFYETRKKNLGKISRC